MDPTLDLNNPDLITLARRGGLPSSAALAQLIPPTLAIGREIPLFGAIARPARGT